MYDGIYRVQLSKTVHLPPEQQGLPLFRSHLAFAKPIGGKPTQERSSPPRQRPRGPSKTLPQGTGHVGSGLLRLPTCLYGTQQKHMHYKCCIFSTHHKFSYFIVQGLPLFDTPLASFLPFDHLRYICRMITVRFVAGQLTCDNQTIKQASERAINTHQMHCSVIVLAACVAFPPSFFWGGQGEEMDFCIKSAKLFFRVNASCKTRYHFLES